ncbi:MAG: NAD-dependent epimerase/dehydratase family protein [Pseudomonadota bacterium]
MDNKTQKIVVTGVAGLIGQNLCLRLHRAGYSNIVGIDKAKGNLDVLRRIQPYVRAIEVDLSEPGDWQAELKDADVVVLNQAQIGGLTYEPFEKNNVTATQRIVEAYDPVRPPYTVQISSSVVNSQADDFYTRSKTAQEAYFRSTGLPGCVLRPTLMFGWFDRKHLGWLRRFMARVPVFPVPGKGDYIRQPLYAGDFCNIINACIQQRPVGEVFDISGQEKITYIDLIRIIKRETGEQTPIMKIPYWMFWSMLASAGLVLRDPPFTTKQLEALVIPEEFPVIDWPGIFNIRATPFDEAVRETFVDSEFSDVVLEF